ncbi:hypothetical protein ABPG72_015336 [Tetrahymena utriculariae]
MDNISQTMKERKNNCMADDYAFIIQLFVIPKQEFRNTQLCSKTDNSNILTQYNSFDKIPNDYWAMKSNSNRTNIQQLYQIQSISYSFNLKRKKPQAANQELKKEVELGFIRA